MEGMRQTLLGYTRDRKGKVENYHPIRISNCITSASGGGGDTSMFVLVENGSLTRIRKLSVKEIGRLMDVDDESIERMDAVNPKTQLLKQFGNSIVVSCMTGLFEQLFFADRQPLKAGLRHPVQLSLFGDENNEET